MRGFQSLQAEASGALVWAAVWEPWVWRPLWACSPIPVWRPEACSQPEASLLPDEAWVSQQAEVQVWRLSLSVAPVLRKASGGPQAVPEVLMISRGPAQVC